MTIDEIVDVVLGTKLEIHKDIGYGLKSDTTRATQRNAAKLEDSLKKVKDKAATVLHGLQKWLDEAETMVENQQSQIITLNSQLEILLARQDDIFKQVQ